MDETISDQVSENRTSYSTYREDWDEPVARWPPVAGWPRVSSFMAKNPHFASFSRFSDLNVKSLLYYQAQLTRLRKQLHIQEHDDKRGYGYDVDDEEYYDEDGQEIAGEVVEHTEVTTKFVRLAEKKQANADAKDARKAAMKFAKRADFLMSAEGSKQLKLITEIRTLLKAYNKALLQYSQMAAIQEPDPFNVKNFKKWLRHDKEGDFEIDIGGNGEENTWREVYENVSETEFSRYPLWKKCWKLLWFRIWPPKTPASDLDLMVIHPPANLGSFTRWFIDYFIPFWEEILSRRDHNEPNPDEESDLEKNESVPSHVPARPGNFNRWVNDYFKPFWRGFRRPRNRNESSLEDDLEGNESFLSAPEEEEDWLLKEGKQGNILAKISDRAIWATGYMSMMLACLFPVIAVTVLAQLHRVKDLLGALAGFVVIFAIGLQVITGGEIRSVDVFSATAVFAAVLVVFIAPAVSH